LGGDCLNVGCVPSKALIRAARAAAQVRDAVQYGVHINGTVEVDFPAIMERMRRLRAQISPNDSAKRFSEELGVHIYIGEAKFTGKDTVTVNGKTLKFAKAIIATGGRAAVPPVPGLETVGYLTNATIFNLTTLPRRLAVIGAGAVGCEMAQCFRRFGSEVYLLFRGKHVMPREDPDAVNLVEESFLKDGIHIMPNTKFVSVGSQNDEKVLQLEVEKKSSS